MLDISGLMMFYTAVVIAVECGLAYAFFDVQDVKHIAVISIMQLIKVPLIVWLLLSVISPGLRMPVFLGLVLLAAVLDEFVYKKFGMRDGAYTMSASLTAVAAMLCVMLSVVV